MKIGIIEFSKTIAKCITEWAKRSAACNGNIESMEQSATKLRKRLDAAFSDSNKVELESDNVNYMLSSVHSLLNNRRMLVISYRVT